MTGFSAYMLKDTQRSISTRFFNLQYNTALLHSKGQRYWSYR